MPQEPSPADHARDLAFRREEKGYYFQTYPDSPIPPAIRVKFQGLSTSCRT